MDSITRNGSKLVLNEVFEGEMRGFIGRGDAFFAVMPNPDTERMFRNILRSTEPILALIRMGIRREQSQGIFHQ